MFYLLNFVDKSNAYLIRINFRADKFSRTLAARNLNNFRADKFSRTPDFENFRADLISRTPK